MMNSYMRQATATPGVPSAGVEVDAVSPEQMQQQQHHHHHNNHHHLQHNNHHQQHTHLQQQQHQEQQLLHQFLKDKQAWDNAIAMYQGNDPLDHWYNYVCWYENHAHRDSESKYRDALQSCLSLFEYNSYYKHDERLVRLWLKYIDMQPNPLHFYQGLYQRDIGRNVAVFYVKWAEYFESISALKEAESVFRLGFQEEAQPFEELQNAYTKFQYIQQQLSFQQQQQQQHELTTTNIKPPQLEQVIPEHHQLQEQQQQEQQQDPQAQPQHPQQHSAQIHNYHKNDTPEQHATQQEMQLQQPHQRHYESRIQPVSVAYQAHHHHQRLHPSHPHTNQIIQAPEQLSHQQQHHQLYNNNNNNHTQQPQQQQQHSHELYMQEQQQQQLRCQPHNMPPIEQPLPAAVPVCHGPAHPEEVPPQQAQHQQPRRRLSNPSLEILTFRPPAKLVAYCRTNHETWKPQLFLAEPDDPCRRCHYAKHLVYPGDGIEYSPEELKARKYLGRIQNSVSVAEPGTPERPQLQEIGSGSGGSGSAGIHLQQNLSSASEAYYGQEEREYPSLPTTTDDDSEDAEEDEDNGGECEAENSQENYEEGEDEEDEGDEVDDGYIPAPVEHHNINGNAHFYPNNGDHQQFEASTIRFSMHSAEHGVQNKSIKIKFKKEGNHVMNGSNNASYTAYTIENVYQGEAGHHKVQKQQQTFDETSASSAAVRRNGSHIFHPYRPGQTSTPKTTGSLKRSKQHKLKHVNKFNLMYANNNSNSSSPENMSAALANGTAETMTSVDSATFNDNANYSFSSAVALDNSNCSLTSAVDRLHFRDTLNNTATATSGGHCNNSVAANSTQRSTALDISTYQENSYFATQHDTEAQKRRLSKALETIERHLAKDAVDPFNGELCRSFLIKLDFPGSDDAHANYKIIDTPLPKLANTRQLNLPEGVQFSIDKEVGRGSYGSVYKATDTNTGNVVALKFQKPPNTWEIYICDQVLKRIKAEHILPGLMDISTAIIAPNASLIATEFSPFGSLLDINNKIRQNTTKVMHESLVMHFSSQICSIIHHLHMNKIIHADIKPDNFLLMRVPSTDLECPSLRLIDFGCAIDMTLFPDENMKFRKVIQTDGFTCVEMQEGRPWSYETDLFCIAGTIHVMLFGEYMQIQKRGSVWDIKQKLPRYLKKNVWTTFFHDMLNIKANKLPNLEQMQEIFDDEVARMDSELQKQIRTLSNILYRR